MQIINFAPSVGMLKFPHPLLSDDRNFERIFRRDAVGFQINPRAPKKDPKPDHERNRGPDELRGVAFRIVAAGRGIHFDGYAFGTSVLNGEENHQYADQSREEDRYRHQTEKK